MNNHSIKVDYSALREAYPGPYVPRNWEKWKDYIPYSPRTLANMDSRGTGPNQRILVGNVICYEKSSLIEWLEGRSRVIP